MLFLVLIGALALDIAVLAWAAGRFDIPLWAIGAYFAARMVQSIYATLKWQDVGRTIQTEFDALKAQQADAQASINVLQNTINLQSRLIADLLDQDRKTTS